MTLHPQRCCAPRWGAVTKRPEGTFIKTVAHPPLYSWKMSNYGDPHFNNVKKHWLGLHHSSSRPDHMGSNPLKQHHLAPTAPGISVSGGQKSEGVTRSFPDTPTTLSPHANISQSHWVLNEKSARWLRRRSRPAPPQSPISYFSTAPWKKQEWARISKRNDRLWRYRYS